MRVSHVLRGLIAVGLTAGGLSLAAGSTAGAVPPGTLDQQVLGPPTAAAPVDATASLAQVFTAGITGTLTGVVINVAPTAPAPTGNLVVAIESVTGSGLSAVPSGTVLGQTTLNPSQVTNGVPTSVTFNSAITSTSGTQYAIVLSDKTEQTGQYLWPVNDAANYKGGSAEFNFGSGWFVESSTTSVPADFLFQTYAQTPQLASTLFVSATGSDTNPCTAAAPCATITHAFSLAGFGATIEVAGTIDDAVTVSTTLSIEQWPGQAPAVVDATGRGTSVITVATTGDLTIDGLTITGGASSSIFNGGGINSEGILTITHSTIADNTTPGSGGGIVEDNNVLTITDSTITGNRAGVGALGGAGGGIFIDFEANAVITDSTITGNSATGTQAGVGTDGGGIADVGHLRLTDSTIAGNSVTGPDARGGGMSSFTTTTGATIIAGNTANGALENCFGSFTSMGYNLTDDATGTSATGAACGFTQSTDKVNEDPDLGALADNGGPTQTLLPAPNSPAVGVIPSPTTLNAVSVCGPGAFDQRGVARPSPFPPRCTIGAVEVSNPSLYGGARLAAFPDGTGYWVVHPDGGVFSYGTAQFFGSLPGLGIHVSDIVGIASTRDGNGYWLVGSDGGVFAFGDATFMGSMGGKPLNQPVVAMAVTPDGSGYWLVASDGGVFSFGDATFSGSMGGKALNQPMVDMAADPAGGYWLVASDGGIFSFGGAPFFGSMGGTPLVEPVVGVTSAPAGTGYWLVASDGGVFAFGHARFAGSLAGSQLFSPIIGLFSTNFGMGYTLVEADGAPVGHF
jgi:hypothetical protein